MARTRANSQNASLPAPAGPPDAYKEMLASKATRGSIRDLLPLVGSALRLIRAEAPRLGLGLLGVQIAVGVLLAVQLVLAQRVIGPLLAGASLATLLAYIVPVVFLVGLSMALGAAQGYLQGLLGEVVSRQTWRQVLATSTRVSLEQFDSPDYFDRLQRVRSNALSRPLQLVQGAISLGSGATSALALFVSLLVIEPVLAPLLVVFAVPLFLVARIGGRIEYAFALEQTNNQRHRAALYELLTERSAAKEVRAFALADLLTARVDALYDAYLEAARAKTIRRMRLAMVSAGFSALLGALALSLLVWLVDQGSVPLASAGLAVVAILLFVQRLGRVSSGVSSILETSMFLRDLDEFLAYDGTSRVALTAPTLRPRHIALRDVAFTYASATQPAISHIDLDLHHGQVLALVGANGSGKTTLSKVLANLYVPSVGSMTWDAVPVSQLDPSEVGRSITILFQDFLRYEMSVADNVSIGDPAAMAEAKAREALQRVRLLDIAESLPEGLDTFLSPRFPGGHDLSTGQWQRLAMARALVRDAPLVILDEPTASLDAKAEADLFATMQDILRDRTVVLVTHRLASARNADLILVLDEGLVVERGTHAQLLAVGGHYASMYELQAQSYRAEAGGEA